MTLTDHAEAPEVPGEPLARVRRVVRAAVPRSPEPPADELPVAQVALDVPLPHLDRPYYYLVTQAQSAAATPGSRVRVRFAGQERQGFVLARVADSGFAGRLSSLSRVVSAEPVLSPEVAALARAVADRWAGTLADVLRLAVPPRHAGVEKEPTAPRGVTAPPPLRTGPWSAYATGAGLVDALAQGRSPRAVWAAAPGEDWPAAIAVLVHACLSSGRGALVVVPDGRDAARVDAALAAELGSGNHVALTAELGPSERYRRWLAVRRGQVRAVVGTRAATYAPVANLGLVVIWDDGDDLHAEPHAPYAHTRDVLVMRAHAAGCAALIAGLAVTAEAALLAATGWAQIVRAERAVLRERGPRVIVSGQDEDVERDPAARSARLPTAAWRIARAALEEGPVLVQVPRAGYVPALACARCRTPARCRLCSGPVGLRERESSPACGWCGAAAGDATSTPEAPATADGPSPDAPWRCAECEGTALRAVAVGTRRTAEELGRAFPAVRVVTSGHGAVVARIPDRPALVVATPGAEPLAPAGYRAALLLDAHIALGRADLRAGEEALRRWMGAAAQVVPASAGGTVVLVGQSRSATVQALLRWDPVGHATRELSDRRALGFPPAARVAALTAGPAALAELLELVDLPASAQILGPTPLPGRGPAVTDGAGVPVHRALIRVPRSDGAALAAALRAAQGVRSARKAPEHVRVQVDPLALG